MAYLVDRTSPIVIGTRGDDTLVGGAPGQVLVGGRGSDHVNPGLNFTQQRLYGDGPPGSGRQNLPGFDVAALGERDVGIDFEIYELHGLDYAAPARIDHFQMGRSHIAMPTEDEAFVFDFKANNWRNEDGHMHADVYFLRIKTPDTRVFREGDGLDVVVHLAEPQEIAFDSPREKAAALFDLMHDVLL